MPHISIESLHLPTALTCYFISSSPQSLSTYLIKSRPPILSTLLTLAWLVSCLSPTFPKESLQSLIPSQAALISTFRSCLCRKMFQLPSASLYKARGNASWSENHSVWGQFEDDLIFSSLTLPSLYVDISYSSFPLLEAWPVVREPTFGISVSWPSSTGHAILGLSVLADSN